MTIRGSTLAAVPAVLALGVLAWWFARHEPTDEERVLLMLDEMRAAAIERESSGILAHVAQGYQDDGGMNRDELRAYLLGFFLGAKSVGVTVLRRRVELQGGVATADLSLLLSRDGQRDGRRLVLRLVREGDEWKVQSSLHEPLGAAP